MSKSHCKESCDFLHQLANGETECSIYGKKLKTDRDGTVRLKKCVRDSNDYKIRSQIQDIEMFYDSFVYEMDIMFENLQKLMERKNEIPDSCDN